jgi:hypothetical protein
MAAAISLDDREIASTRIRKIFASIVRFLVVGQVASNPKFCDPRPGDTGSAEGGASPSPYLHRTSRENGAKANATSETAARLLDPRLKEHNFYATNRPQSSPASRFTAGAAGFLIF